ncbi:MAG: hypothetical protein WA071_21115 [Undibacterium umbellatum]|uniref:hypothetical protein n=1 Tax=Undibacterium umbellatum TaxID=2762300 RepID=UPI003BB6DFD4
MTTQQKKREFALSLRMTHPEIDLQAFCDLIELVPWKCHLAGELRQIEEGRLLGGVHKLSFCTCVFEFDEDVSLEDVINIALDDLESKRNEIADMTSSGGEIHFFIGWFFEGTAGMILDWKTLRRMSDLKISFQLDAYGTFL